MRTGLILSMKTGQDMIQPAYVYKRLQRLGRRKKDMSKEPRPLPRLKVSEDRFANTFEECQEIWKKQFAVIEAGIEASEMQIAQLHATCNNDSVREPDNCPDPCQILALIRRFKNGKVPGPGQLPVDIIKSGGICYGQTSCTDVDQGHLAHQRTTQLERRAFGPAIQGQGLTIRAFSLQIHFPL